MKKKLFLASLIYIYSVTPQNAYAIKDATSFNPEPVKVEAKNNSVPIGTVIVWTKNEIPEGWLECNGQAVNQNLYPDLFALMNKTPNYIGRFLEGNITTGEIKEAGLPNITGKSHANDSEGGLDTNGAFYKVSGQFTTGGYAGYNNVLYFDASRSNPIYGRSNTVQPPSITVKYIIKAE